MNDAPEVETIYVLDSDLKADISKKIILTLVGIAITELALPLSKKLYTTVKTRRAAAKAAETEEA